MAREFFKNLPDTTTPLTAPRLNALLDGDEAMGNIVVDSIRSKNILDYYIPSTANVGITVSMESTQIKLNGTTTGSGNIYYSSGNTITLEPGTYTISTRILSGTFTRNSKELALYFRNASSGTNISEILSSTNYEKTTTFTINNETPMNIYVYTNGSGFVANNLVIGLQIETGSTATSYSLYQGIGYVSGSNANGNYLKYDDGTLLCWGILNTSANQASKDIQLPIEFINANYSVVITNIYYSSKKIIWTVVNTNKAYFTVYPMDYEGNNVPQGATQANYMAIGRWK